MLQCPQDPVEAVDIFGQTCDVRGGSANALNKVIDIFGYFVGAAGY
jgi:hypothetical protein